jgi:DNA-binding MarR family transcriptional regulator
MTFSINLVSGPMMTDESELHKVALPFLNAVGYLPEGYDPRTGVETVLESVPYRLFAECFLGHLDKVWSVGEMARTLRTSIPTVYRHLDKLSALDLLGQGSLEKDVSRKGYFIRYHDLSQAWRFTEVNIDLSLAAYRKAVDIIQKGVAPARRAADKEPNRNLGAEGDFSLRVVNAGFPFSDKWESVAVEFLLAVDFLSDIGQPDPKKVCSGVPFRLLTECLLRRPDVGWTIDDLSAHLETTKPTVYRYLRKLSRVGVLEKSVPEMPADEGEHASAAGAAQAAPDKPPAKRRYRIRRGNLSKAWNATEFYAKTVMAAYRRTVDHMSGFGEHKEG